MSAFKHLSWWSILSGLLALTLCPLNLSAALLECPDCDNMVSLRAAFCPKCGCPIEFIKQEQPEARQETQAVSVATCFVRIATEHGEGYGVAATIGGDTGVVFNQSRIAGATSLSIEPVTTNTLVPYRDLRLADDRPLVRLSTPDTNLFYLAASSSVPSKDSPIQVLMLAGAGSAMTSTWTTVTAVDGPYLQFSLAVEPGSGVLAVADAQTNLVAVVDLGQREATGVLSGTLVVGAEWKPMRPGDFRTQSGLLRKAQDVVAAIRQGATVAPDRLQALVHGLGKTDWGTEYMGIEARRLEASLKKLSGGEPDDQEGRP